MNTSFSHPALGVLRFVLASLASLVASLATGILLQGVNPFPSPTHPEFFRLMVGVALILGPALLFLVERSRYHGLRLVGLTLAVYIGSAQVLSHFETIAFNFLFQFGPAELAYLIGSEALTALFLVPLVITVAGRWKAPTEPVEDRTGTWLPPAPSFWVRTGILAVLWYFGYMLAGFFIADPITHGYYEAKLADLASINAWLPLLQVVRGVLWTLLFVLAVRVMNRPLAEAGLLVGLLFGVYHAAGLLLPSTFMPAEMRLSHLPEIVLSLSWQGCLTVAVLGWKKRN